MKVITVPGFSVTRNTSASGLVWRSSAKPSLGVIAAMRVEPRSGQKMPEFDQPEMRRDDQPVELLVGGVGEREHGPVAGRARVIGLDLDAPHDAVGSGRGRNLEILALVAVDFDGARKVERDVVAGNLDRFDGEGRGRRAQRQDCRQDKGEQRARFAGNSSKISPSFQRPADRPRSGRRGSGPARCR